MIPTLVIFREAVKIDFSPSAISAPLGYELPPDRRASDDASTSGGSTRMKI
jgi:hypothetical protein